MSDLAKRRLSYYATIVVGALVVHQAAFLAVTGSAVTDLFRRNNEAYVMMLFIPLYWDLFAWSVDPDGRGERATVGGPSASQPAWFGGLVVVAIALQPRVWDDVGIELSETISTLGEAVLGAIVVSAYLGWSRGLISIHRREIDGAPVVGIGSRLAYYGGVVVVATIIQQNWLTQILGDPAVEWLQVNAEALAAMVLVAAAFDLTAVRGRSTAARVTWYVFLLVAPIFIFVGFLDWILGEPLVAWLQQTTEAFVAAAVISLYLDVWRGRAVNHASSSRAGQAPHGPG